MRRGDWAPLVFLPIAVAVLTPDTSPRWVFMWLLAGAIFAGCKWLTWRRTPVEGVPWWRHAGYLVAWPGFDAEAFLRLEPPPEASRPNPREWSAAAGRLIIGAAIVWGACRLVSEDLEILRGWIGMIGLVLVLHFGSFHLISCAWRSAGIAARPVMNRPLISTSVSEFWGKRWNTAFRDLTHRFLFLPLKTEMGARGAIMGGFVASGLVHDIVISVPAEGGYGLPTLFFAIQAFAILIERSSFGRSSGLDGGWSGWLFAMIVIVSPAYGLFHPPFIQNVMLPFLKALGAF